MILHHESFFLYYYPIFCIIYLYGIAIKNNKRNLLCLFLAYSMPVILTFLVVTINNGNNDTVQHILNSYNNTDAALVRGGIMALGWKFEDSHNLSIRMITDGHLFQWLFFLSLFISYASLAATVFPEKSVSKKIASLGVFWLFLCSGIMAYSGWDWGRWISISTVSTVLICTLINSIFNNVDYFDE